MMMKIFTKIVSVVILCLLIGFSACKDDADAKTCTSGAFEMKVDNVKITASTFNNTLLKSTSAGVAGKRMDIRATDGDGTQWIITFTDLTNGTNGDDVATGTYVSFDDIQTGEENTFIFAMIKGTVVNTFTSGTLTVTKSEGVTVSGIFSFTDGDIAVTNGVFTDMCYTVLK